MKSLNTLGINYYLIQASSDEPTVEPIATSDAQIHLYSASSDDQTMIGSMIKAGRMLVEKRIPGGRSLINQTWNLYLDAFPTGDEAILLPNPPAQSITSVGYYDAAGSSQTYATSDVRLFAPNRSQGWIKPPVDAVWPGTDLREDAVRITYKAGYGDQGSKVPETLRLAIKQLVGHWYRNRESVLTGTISKEIEHGVDALLAAEAWGYYG